MQRSPRTAAVRLPLLTFLAVALAVAVLEPALAGTQAAPEIADPAGDGTSDFAATLGDRDLVNIWIDDALADGGEAGPSLMFNVETSADFDHISSAHALHERMRIGFVPTAGLPDGAVEAYVSIRPGLGTGQANAGQETVSCQVGFSAEAGGSMDINLEVAGTATFEGNLYHCLVPLSAMPGFDPAAGHKLTQLSATFELVTRGPVSGGTGEELLPVLVHDTYDTAPDEGFGQDWSLAGGGAPLDPNDTDGDGMNDTCEQQYFGNLTAANATGDADSDGLTNGQECALGTDPTKADTDGDGTPDGSDPFPNDPTRGGTSSSTSSTSRPTSSSRSTSRSTATDTAGDDDDVKSLSDAAEKLKSDPGYLGLSGGGFLAVLVLCIIALAVRWSL